MDDTGTGGGVTVEIQVTVTGVREAVAALGRAEVEILLAYKAEVQDSLTMIGDVARDRAPFLTGKLSASYPQGVSVDADGLGGRVGSNVEYSKWVELGHRTRGGYGWVPPQPHLEPAWEEVMSGFQQRVTARINGAVAGLGITAWW